MNITLQFAGDKNTKICGTAKVKCYKESKRKLSIDKNARWFRDECNCLPACTSIEYHTSIVRIHIDWEAIMKTYNTKEL